MLLWNSLAGSLGNYIGSYADQCGSVAYLPDFTLSHSHPSPEPAQGFMDYLWPEIQTILAHGQTTG
jgi:hypothetical protein